ncbi:MAG: 1-(5-phosphoribosyl)-5-[(5-phosphoribosylamino)methylideneamino]imidazole-4-carboxamide isomerase [Parvibaculales bacterium]
MILFPAIDLKGGKCVRLKRGEMESATIFENEPAEQARVFAEQGFSHLHIIDLDGAFAGVGVNGGEVEKILAATPLAAQLGGGVRDMKSVGFWLERGVARVILGTSALQDPDFVREAISEFGAAIAIAIDARGGKVAVEGWAKQADVSALVLAREMEQAGAGAIIHTDIDRDGVLAGVNLGASLAIASEVSTPLIVSGGVASLADIRAIRDCGAENIIGAIAGRALYEGALDAGQVLALEGVE